MRYSIEPRDIIYVKGYGFLSFAKNRGKYLSNKYGQKLLNNAKKSKTDGIKTASKRATGHKIADKITSVSINSAKELSSDETEVDILEKIYISPEERQQIDSKFVRQYIKATI